MVPLQIRITEHETRLTAAAVPYGVSVVQDMEFAFIVDVDGEMQVMSPYEFACHSKACAPPPAGVGGSSPSGGSQEISVGIGAKGAGAPSPEVSDMTEKGRKAALDDIHKVPGWSHVKSVEEAVDAVEKRLSALIDVATTHDLLHGNPDDSSRTGPYDGERVNATGHWYDVANNYVSQKAAEHGFIHHETAAGVYATLSPGARWPSNVTNGDVTMRFVGENKKVGAEGIKDLHYRLKLAVTNKRAALAKKGEDTSELDAQLADMKSPQFLAALSKKYGGKTFNQLPEEVAAKLIQGHIQRHALKETNITPHGDGSFDVSTGTRKAIIQSVSNFKKAIRIAKADKSSDEELRAVLDKNVSNFSKVRSFYMNIAYPQNRTQDSVTLDTHAFAGLMGQPLSLTGATQFFRQTKEIGYATTYPIMRAAMNRVAKKLHKLGLDSDLTNRAVQSVTWEMGRALLPDRGKSAMIKGGKGPDTAWGRANKLYEQGKDREAWEVLSRGAGGIE